MIPLLETILKGERATIKYEAVLEMMIYSAAPAMTSYRVETVTMKYLEDPEMMNSGQIM